jgi:hypothetical protein
VLENLPSKPKILSLNPNTPKKKKVLATLGSISSTMEGWGGDSNLVMSSRGRKILETRTQTQRFELQFKIFSCGSNTNMAIQNLLVHIKEIFSGHWV